MLGVLKFNPSKFQNIITYSIFFHYTKKLNLLAGNVEIQPLKISRLISQKTGQSIKSNKNDNLNNSHIKTRSSAYHFVKLVAKQCLKSKILIKNINISRANYGRNTATPPHQETRQHRLQQRHQCQALQDSLLLAQTSNRADNPLCAPSKFFKCKIFIRTLST